MNEPVEKAPRETIEAFQNRLKKLELETGHIDVIHNNIYTIFFCVQLGMFFTSWYFGVSPMWGLYILCWAELLSRIVERVAGGRVH